MTLWHYLKGKLSGFKTAEMSCLMNNPVTSWHDNSHNELNDGKYDGWWIKALGSIYINSSPPSAAYMGQHWFTYWLAAYLSPSHYLNQCCVIINWTIMKKLQWNFSQKFNFFIHKNAQIGRKNIYRKVSNIRRTKSPNLNVSRLVLELS